MVRQELGLREGDRVALERNERGRYEIVPLTKKYSLDDLFGMLKPPQGVSFTLEELADAAAIAVAEDDIRIMREWHASEEAASKEEESAP
jgi:bifunctional DNA-binding transcriptional regulator/antitoxin component of YhaV-PrlF toxin-antitoxin module